MFIPTHELTKSDIGKTATVYPQRPDYLIAAIDEDRGKFKNQNGDMWSVEVWVTFKNHLETFTTNESFYVRLHNELKTLTFERNLESRIIHAVMNNQNLCGVRHSQNSETTNTEYATCDRCVELINK